MQSSKFTLSRLSIFYLLISIIQLSLFEKWGWTIPETHYRSEYYESILPRFLKSNLGQFIGKKNKKIAYSIFENPNEKAALVILTGRGLPMINYTELVTDLEPLELSAYLMDHRGQGYSDRIVTPPHVQFVDHFQDYVDDVHTFFTQIVQAKKHKKIILIGESLGGAVGTLFQIQNPGIVDGIILSAPMFGVVGLSELSWIASPIANAEIRSGHGADYFLHEEKDPAFFGNLLTSSRERYLVRQEFYREYPETLIDGVSYQWISAILDGMAEIKSKVNLYSTPTLLFQAGKDQVVKKRSQNYFCANTRRCQLVKIPDSKHELLFERDQIRNQVIQEIQKFIEDLLASNRLQSERNQT